MFEEADSILLIFLQGINIDKTSCHHSTLTNTNTHR